MAAATKTAGHPEGGPATKTDQAHLKSEAGKADRARAHAYNAGLADGKAGTPDEHRPLEADLDEYYDHGLEEGQRERAKKAPAPAASPSTPPAGSTPSTPAPGPPAGSITSKPAASSSGGGSKTTVAEDGAGFLVGVLAYALVLNYLKYGWPGVTGWLSAKFLNKVTIGANAQQTQGPTQLVPNANPAASSPGNPVPAPQQGVVLA